MSNATAVVTYPSDAILTTEQAAEVLQVSTKMIYRLPIPVITLGARTRRYRMSDITAFLETRRGP